jgi:hypothetical protein
VERKEAEEAREGSESRQARNDCLVSSSLPPTLSHAPSVLGAGRPPLRLSEPEVRSRVSGIIADSRPLYEVSQIHEIGV